MIMSCHGGPWKNSLMYFHAYIFFFSSRRRHTRCYRDWSSDVCSSDLSRAASAYEDTVTVGARCARASAYDPADAAALPRRMSDSHDRRDWAYPRLPLRGKG